MWSVFISSRWRSFKFKGSAIIVNVSINDIIGKIAIHRSTINGLSNSGVSWKHLISGLFDYSWEISSHWKKTLINYNFHLTHFHENFQIRAGHYGVLLWKYFNSWVSIFVDWAIFTCSWVFKFVDFIFLKKKWKIKAFRNEGYK